MLSYSDLDNEQLKLIDRIYEHDVNFIYATMGSGKTVCTLTAISELLRDGVITRALVIAPLRPANEVWAAEHEHWAHLSHLSVAVATGSPTARLRAIHSGAQIVVINIENSVWFFNTFKRKHNFDCLVIDELSKFGSSTNKCVKKLKVYTDSFTHKTGLTASPTHEGFDRLFAQTLVLDGGARFGRNKQNFLNTFFYAEDYEQRKWALLGGDESALMSHIDDIFYAMPDYTANLPALTEYVEPFTLSEREQAYYDDFLKHSVLEIGSEIVVADNAAVLSGKLEQVTSGFVYDGDDVIELSDTLARKNLFCSLRERLGDSNCLIFYSLDEEKRQILDALDDYKLISDKGAIDDWNNGLVRNFVLHPKSASHGLNLARGGHTIICYSPIWSNDAFKQLVARLWRRSQQYKVSVYTLACKGTVDDIKLNRLDDKQEYDALLRAHIKSRA